MTMRKVKCPFCGYKFQADPEKRYATGRTNVVRGKDTPQAPSPQQRQRSVDLICPNCGEDFEEKVEG